MDLMTVIRNTLDHLHPIVTDFPAALLSVSVLLDLLA
jgi:uncharacterized membrane protein